MNNKPTSLALSIFLLQLIQWTNILVFILLLGYYFYGLTFESELISMSILISGKLLGAFLGLFFAILLHFTVKGVFNKKKWARIVIMILGVFMLFGFPAGTIVGILLIYSTTKGWPME